MRVRFISLDSDVLDSISKMVNQKGTMRSSRVYFVAPFKRAWYSSSFEVNYRDIEAIKDFIGVYGYSIFKDKYDSSVFILKPFEDFLPNIEDRIE